MAKKMTFKTEILQTVELVDKDINWINKYVKEFEVKGYGVVKSYQETNGHSVILNKVLSMGEYIELIKETKG